jgi:hypothetical protein
MSLNVTACVDRPSLEEMLVSRLYDRLRRGCAPFRFSDLDSLAALEERFGRFVVSEAPRAAARLGGSLRDLGRIALGGEPTGVDRIEPAKLAGMPVVVADELADYCDGLPETTCLSDVVSTLAPPFPHLFVECTPARHSFRGTPLHAFGVNMATADLTDDGNRPLVPDRGARAVMAALSGEAVPEEVPDTPVRWLLVAEIVLEPRKGHPCGPVAHYEFPLGDDGCLIRTATGEIVDLETIVGLEPPVGDEVATYLCIKASTLLVPAFLAVSVMHCRNVEVRTVDPPAALARQAARRGGPPLCRYHVLDIAPMRRILDTQGDARRRGLGHALHVCRGHFKTYTADAPLFGRHVGQYWWADHARGAADRGRVDKDYRVILGSPAGR